MKKEMKEGAFSRFGVFVGICYVFLGFWIEMGFQFKGFVCDSLMKGL